MDATVTTSTQRTRDGTARRRSGKDTAAKIVRTAYELLMSGGYADFSMRNIAEQAGIRLANLQYYYPKKEDLIHALVGYVGELYDQSYAQCLENAGDSPLERFHTAMEFNLADINNLETRHFFIQLWPLLGVADNYSGELLAELYTPQLDQIGQLISELHPDAPPDDVKLRAEMIAAMIEGLMVVVLTPQEAPANLDKLKEKVIRHALLIAAG